jgi:hypothetical protein
MMINGRPRGLVLSDSDETVRGSIEPFGPLAANLSTRNGTPRDPAPVYGRPLRAMPEPGDLITAFSLQPGRHFRMVQSRLLQATHCRGTPASKGIRIDPKGKSWHAKWRGFFG